MKHPLLALSLVVTLALPVIAHARNDLIKLKIQEALANAEAQSKLGDNIQFYFGDAKTPKVSQRLGEDVANRKTNAFNKSDEMACQWAFLSAMVALKEKAQRLGANAVINIRSYSDRVEKSSETEYECTVGNVVAGVALKGVYAKVE